MYVLPPNKISFAYVEIPYLLLYLGHEILHISSMTLETLLNSNCVTAISSESSSSGKR